MMITLGNKQKVRLSGFRDVKMIRGILQTPPRGRFPQIFVLTQVGGVGGGEITTFAISDAYSLPCT